MGRKRCSGLALFVAAIVCSASSTVYSAVVQWSVVNGGNGHWYEIVDAPNITWDDANTTAASLSFMGVDGHLATLTSAAENSFIQQLLPGTTDASLPGTNDYGQIYLLGGKQTPGSKEPDGGWSWITGELWEYTDWSHNNPNNDAGQNVLGIYNLPTESLFHGHWDDYWEYGGVHTFGYIVEYDVESGSVPEPTSLVLWTGIGAMGLVAARRRKRKA